MKQLFATAVIVPFTMPTSLQANMLASLCSNPTPKTSLSAISAKYYYSSFINNPYPSLSLLKNLIFIMIEYNRNTELNNGVHVFYCRRGVHTCSAKKTEQFFAKNVTFQSTEPMNIPRNITGFFSRVWSSPALAWTQIHRPPVEILDQEQTDQDPDRFRIKTQPVLPARLKTTWLATLVRSQQAAFLNTWLKPYPVTVSKTFLKLLLHLMVSVRFAVHPIIILL